MCVCMSMKPGRTVACERSTTCAPAGGVPPGVTETILPSWTRMSAFAIGWSLLPSINFPARMATCLGDWAKAVMQDSRTATKTAIRRNMRPPSEHFGRTIGDVDDGYKVQRLGAAGQFPAIAFVRHEACCERKCGVVSV